MQILVLLDIYFDAVVLEVKTLLLLFRFTLAILCYLNNLVVICTFQTENLKNIHTFQLRNGSKDRN